VECLTKMVITGATMRGLVSAYEGDGSTEVAQNL